MQYTGDPPTMAHGPWLPTNYLRWRKIADTQVLEQKMRRKVHQYQRGYTNKYYEYEWQSLQRFTP